MKKIILISLLVVLFHSNLFAACGWDGNTGTVASPYAISDLEDCVSDASALTGEVTIIIPNSVTWTDGRATVDMSSGFANVTKLTITGTGTLPTTCQSALDEGFSTPTSCGSSGDVVITLSNATLYVIGEASKEWRVTNLSFTGGTYESYPGVFNAAIEVGGQTLVSSGGGFRVDHITFSAITDGRCIKGGYYQNGGVIDHIDSGVDGQFSTWLVATTGGNYQWANPVNQQDATWLEDSYLEDTDVSSGYGGMVFNNDNGYSVGVRHCTIINYYIGGHDCSSVERSGRFYAAYNNISKTTLSSSTSLYTLRGGEHYVYNNQLVATQATPFLEAYGDGITLQNYRTATTMGAVDPWDSYCDNTPELGCLGVLSDSVKPKTCTNDADCGGESGSCRNLDINSGGQGWPCRDQIGVGEDQELRPSLFWNNTLKIQSGEPAAIAPLVRTASETVIQVNRDYCTDASTMPSSCNSIDTVYTEYTYPHPLRGEGSGESEGSGRPSISNIGTGHMITVPGNSDSGMFVTVD